MAKTAKATSALAPLLLAMARGDVRIVDLTQTLSPDFPTLVLPPELGQCAPFRIEEVSRYDNRGPAWYWNNITMSEHTGTHFDAPVHWISGRHLPHNAVDSIPPEHFLAPAVVIDISAAAASNPDHELSVDEIRAWEKKHGRVPPKCWVLLRTDWSKLGPADYVNLKEDGAHTPGPGANAVRFLVEERNILGLGVETIGTDTGQAAHSNPPFPAHYILHGNGRYGLQCLTNLDRLPPTGTVILAAPLKIRNGSGSPLRVLALIEGPQP
jgi:kynurenine formamidase